MSEREQNQTFTDWLSQYKALLFKVVRAVRWDVLLTVQKRAQTRQYRIIVK